MKVVQLLISMFFFQRYVALPWWDPTLDKATPPQYQYDSRLDQWKPICHPIFIVDEEEKRKGQSGTKAYFPKRFKIAFFHRPYLHHV